MPKDENKAPKPESTRNEKVTDLPERKEQDKDDKVKGGANYKYGNITL